jgi:hypothetical protein
MKMTSNNVNYISKMKDDQMTECKSYGIKGILNM